MTEYQDEIKLESLAVGPLETNCYLLISSKTKECLVVDPGGSVSKIWEKIESEDLKPVAIVNTHGHWDHVLGNSKIHTLSNAPIYMHPADIALWEEVVESRQQIRQIKAGMSDPFSLDGLPDALIGEEKKISKVEFKPLPIEEGDVLKVGEIEVKVIHTPGHSPGGISLLAGDYLLSGDTLFEQFVGRTDFKGGDHRTLISSIKNKLMVLPDQVKVYPGHGPATTIGRERIANPYLQN